MVPPLIDCVLSFLNRSEPALIQAFVPELAIEAFDNSILAGLACLDKPKLCPSISPVSGKQKCMALLMNLLPLTMVLGKRRETANWP